MSLISIAAHVLLLGLTVFCIVATVLPMSKAEQWWVRVFDYPRLQIGILAIGTLVAYLAFGLVDGWIENTLLVGLGLCIVYQFYLIIAYTPIAPRQVKRMKVHRPDHELSLFVANVLMPNRRSQDLLPIIHRYDPDIIFLVETDSWWADAMEALDSQYPYTLKRPLDNTYGLLFYSRLELVDPQLKYLINEAIPSVHTHVRLASGDLIRLYGLHPDPPNPEYAEITTERDAELLVVAAEVRQEPFPTVVMGDFNDVAWSHTTRLFQRISGLLDPRRGRGFFSTFHADYPFMRWPLDHIFHSDHFGLVHLERSDKWGSDHLPVFARLVYKPHDPQSSDLEPEDGDIEEAVDKVERATED